MRLIAPIVIAPRPVGELLKSERYGALVSETHSVIRYGELVTYSKQTVERKPGNDGRW